MPRPDLQIVSDELWEAVKARRAEVRIVMTQMVKTRHRAEDEGRLEASAALWFAPLSPPGTTRPRQAQGAGPTELAGLAGTQPVLAKMGAGAQPTAR